MTKLKAVIKGSKGMCRRKNIFWAAKKVYVKQQSIRITVAAELTAYNLYYLCKKFSFHTVTLLINVLFKMYYLNDKENHRKIKHFQLEK